MMKFTYLLVIVPALLIILKCEAQTLDDYLAIAHKNSPELKAKQEEFEAALQRIPQVSSLPDPSLSASLFGQMVETRVGQQMARFSLSQMFPWFGTLGAQKEATTLVAQAKYESYRDAQNELFFRVRSAYYPLFELEETIRLQEENLEILSTYKSLATTKFQNGMGKLADALRVDIMMNDIKSELGILSIKRKPLQVAFNNLLNRPVDERIEISNEFQMDSLLISRDSLLQNPKLIELNTMIDSEKVREQVAKKQGMPNLGIGFEYIIVDKRPDMSFEDNGKDAYMPMFTVSLPIYRKKYKGAVSEAQHMQQSYAWMKEAIVKDLASEFEMALFERSKSKTEIDLYEQQIRQTDQVVNLLVTGFSNSGTDFEEILSMQQALIKYRMNKVSAIKNFLVAEAKLRYLVANDMSHEKDN